MRSAGRSTSCSRSASGTAVFGIPEAVGHLTPGIVASGAGLAILLPVLPYTLELRALRHMTLTAFGTLMAIEPAIGVLLGLVVLHQTLSAVQAAGVLLVVLAGAAAQRDGLRHAPSTRSQRSGAALDVVG